MRSEESPSTAHCPELHRLYFVLSSIKVFARLGEIFGFLLKNAKAFFHFPKSRVPLRRSPISPQSRPMRARSCRIWVMLTIRSRTRTVMKIKVESAYMSGLTVFFVIAKILSGSVWKSEPVV